MEAVRLLPQSKILQEWWQEVKENFWEADAKPQVLKLVKELKVFRRYRRYQDIVEDIIIEGIFLAGVSTRRVGESVSKLLDTKVSYGTVSNITKRIDAKRNIEPSLFSTNTSTYSFPNDIKKNARTSS